MKGGRQGVWSEVWREAQRWKKAGAAKWRPLAVAFPVDHSLSHQVLQMVFRSMRGSWWQSGAFIRVGRRIAGQCWCPGPEFQRGSLFLEAWKACCSI